MRALLCLLACSALHAQLFPFPGPGMYTPAGGVSFPLDFTTGTLPTGVSLTRSSSATYLDASGVLTTATSNAARFNYISATPYLLIEPAGVNLVQYSNGFTFGSWYSNNSAVVTAAQFTSVDGTNDGWSLTAGSGFGARGNAFTAAATTYTQSIWCKRITGTAPLILQIGATNSGNITTSGTLTRYSYSQTLTAGSQNVFIYVGAASGANGIFGVQVEAGSVATSYIPNTTGGTASRAADVVTFLIGAGVGHLTYTFDDNSTQVVAVSSGAYTIPTNLNRPNIKSIASGA